MCHSEERQRTDFPLKRLDEVSYVLAFHKQNEEASTCPHFPLKRLEEMRT